MLKISPPVREYYRPQVRLSFNANANSPKGGHSTKSNIERSQATKARFYADRLSRSEVQKRIAEAEAACDAGEDFFLDLSGVNLSGVDLSNLDLSSTILEKANLRGANLTGTSLDSSKLWRANLTDAILDSTNFKYTDLRRSNWQKAKAVKNIKLEKANLRAEDLRFLQSPADWKPFQFAGADLTAANLEALKIPNEALNGKRTQHDFLPTILNRANLKGVKFLSDKKGGRPILTNISALGAFCENIDFNKAEFGTDVCFDFANLLGADFRQVSSIRPNFSSYVSLRAADLRSAKFAGTDMDWQISRHEITNDGLDLNNYGEVYVNNLLEHSNLCGLDLSGRDLKNLNLDCAMLIGVNFNNADLSGADIRMCDFSFANLTNTDFSNALGFSPSPLYLYAALVKPGYIEDQVMQKDSDHKDFDYKSYEKPTFTNECDSFIAFDLSNRDLSKMDFINADLRGVNLSNSNLAEANLQNADLMGANLSGANLSNANLIDTDLTNVNFARATLDGADFLHATWSGEINLKGAKAHGSKYLPKSIARYLDFGDRSYQR